MENKELQDNPLNEKESIELIARMIRNTQRGLARGAGTPMLLWGYATLAATAAVWLAARLTADDRWNYLWFMIPLIGLPGMLFCRKRTPGVHTYIDRVIRYVWFVLGTTGFMLSMLSIASSMWALPILFIIILIMGMGSVLTGLVIEFKPMIIGGTAGMLVSIPHYLVSGYDIKMLTFALAFAAMYIIPGHILNRKARNACSAN
ncbi:MAG: hypothetical protein LBJ23_09930 [Tannerella sp.]|nr:hypothetical protein [Tannerella sp.]